MQQINEVLVYVALFANSTQTVLETQMAVQLDMTLYPALCFHGVTLSCLSLALICLSKTFIGDIPHKKGNHLS
jgi:uncharacterized membrane protein YbjE (DUF340 family)